MNQIYLSRAYNYGCRNDWKSFLQEMYDKTEQGLIHPDDTEALLNQFIDGRAYGTDAQQHIITTPHMRKKMWATLDIALREAYVSRKK